MYFDEKAPVEESTRGRSPIRLLKSPAIMALGNSKMFIPKNLNELCDRIKLLLQEKKAGISSDIINVEIVAIVDKLLEDKCISTKQHTT